MTLAGFCREVGYARNTLSGHVVFKSWHQEKLARIINDSDDDARERAIKVRGKLILNQLKAIDECPDLMFRAKNLVSMSMFVHEMAVAEDMKDIKAEKHKEKGWKPRSAPLDQIAQIVFAAKSATDGVLKTTGVANDYDSVAMDLMKKMAYDAESFNSAAQSDTKHTMTIKGMGLVDPDQMRKLFKEWIDPPQPKALAAPDPIPQLDPELSFEDDDG